MGLALSQAGFTHVVSRSPNNPVAGLGPLALPAVFGQSGELGTPIGNALEPLLFRAQALVRFGFSHRFGSFPRLPCLALLQGDELSSQSGRLFRIEQLFLQVFRQIIERMEDGLAAPDRFPLSHGPGTLAFLWASVGGALVYGLARDAY